MKTPPLAIGGALLFWGIETQRLLIGMILVILLEGSNLVKVRYDLDEDDFVKISDLTSLIFLGTVALIVLNIEGYGFLRITTGWLPAVLFPLIMAQLYSTGDTVTIGTRLGRKQKTYAHKPLDFRLYYVVICVFAAAAGNSGSLTFTAGAGVIFGSIFLVNRGKAYSLPYVVVFLTIALSLACLTGVALVKGHSYMVNRAIHFIHDYYGHKLSDPFKTNVNFGDTGRLKSSGEIIMRIDAETPPSLLKVADYVRYSKRSWFGNNKGYVFLAPIDQENWALIDDQHNITQSVTVEAALPKEKGLLALPYGSFKLNSTTLYEIEQNLSGNVRVKDGAPIVTYTVGYDDELNKRTNVPSDANLLIPKEELYVLDQVTAHFDTEGKHSAEKIKLVTNYFAKGFGYSLTLLGAGDYATPLGNFLLHKKQGFCEYYATATTLLLRSLGIPSRYVIGFAVSEKSLVEGKYIVRKRHAHAWSEAFVEGRWRVVDTTPADWLKEDEERASFFEPLRDLFSLIRHKYQLFRIGGGEDYTLYFSLAVVGLTIFLVVRIYRRMKLQQAGREKHKEGARYFARVVTPFTPVIDYLDAVSHSREQGESFAGWAGRIYNWQGFDEDEFVYLYGLHLKKRFDPEGLNESETAELEEGGDRYLANLEESRSAVVRQLT